MSRRRKPDPKAPRPGDFLHIVVPANRHLAAGCYRARIESLGAKPRRYDGQSYHCAIVISEHDFDDEDAILIHFRLTIYSHPSLHGQCFLGFDQFPVQFRHEPCLERRLIDSLPKERLPYADD